MKSYSRREVQVRCQQTSNTGNNEVLGRAVWGEVESPFAEASSTRLNPFLCRKETVLPHGKGCTVSSHSFSFWHLTSAKDWGSVPC